MVNDTSRSDMIPVSTWSVSVDSVGVNPFGISSLLTEARKARVTWAACDAKMAFALAIPTEEPDKTG